jgi:hypothetical protein
MLFSVHGFFGETSRDTIVIVGLLLLIWVPSIALPRTISRVAGVLAAASLYIYLSHFQVFMPLLAHGVAPIYAVLASLLVGIVLWWGASAITAGASGRWAPASDYLRRVRGADGRPTKSDGGRTIVR